jgi:hypothetical protein
LGVNIDGYLGQNATQTAPHVGAEAIPASLENEMPKVGELIEDYVRVTDGRACSGFDRFRHEARVTHEAYRAEHVLL